MKGSYNFYRGEKITKEPNRETYFNILTRGVDPYNPGNSVEEKWFPLSRIARKTIGKVIKPPTFEWLIK